MTDTTDYVSYFFTTQPLKFKKITKYLVKYFVIFLHINVSTAVKF